MSKVKYFVDVPRSVFFNKQGKHLLILVHLNSSPSSIYSTQYNSNDSSGFPEYITHQSIGRYEIFLIFIVREEGCMIFSKFTTREPLRHQLYDMAGLFDYKANEGLCYTKIKIFHHGKFLCLDLNIFLCNLFRLLECLIIIRSI